MQHTCATNLAVSRIRFRNTKRNCPTASGFSSLFNTRQIAYSCSNAEIVNTIVYTHTYIHTYTQILYIHTSYYTYMYVQINVKEMRFIFKYYKLIHRPWCLISIFCMDSMLIRRRVQRPIPSVFLLLGVAVSCLV